MSTNRFWFYYLDECVIQDKHHRGEIPGNFGVPEQILPDIADITNIWMPQTELPT
jgi:hypothetical protein